MKRFCPTFVATILMASAAAAADPTIAIDLGGGTKLEMVLVKKGTFLQGSPNTEQNRGNDESQRQVAITQDFYLGKFPVTVGQFAQFVRNTGYRTEAERGTSGGFGFDGKGLVQRQEFTWRKPGFPQTDAHPVTTVTYGDAQAMARWLAKKTYRKVTLPTEAQWEYACRAGTTGRFYNGDADDDLQKIAWFRDNSGNGTRPVGQKQPNAFGLDDMSGNIYQWCRDWYGPYEGQNVKDPEETRADRTKPPRRVLRGGSWLKEAQHCRSAARWRNTPASRNADNGFRLAASVEIIVEREDARRTQPPRGPSVPVVTISNVDQGAGFALALDIPLLGLACLAVFVLVVVVLVVVAVMLVGRQAGRSDYRPPSAPGGFPIGSQPYTEDADDGFWLNLAGIEAGSVIRYRCLVHNVVQQNSVVAEMGPRQFVYTGGRPSNIAILEIIPPGGTPAVPPVVVSPVIVPPILPPVHEHRPPPPPPPPEPPSFSGFPAAY